MSVLVIRNVDETDYGEYVCEASNKHGTSEFSINLEGEKLPEVPRRLGVLKVGTSWIQVGWLPSVRDSEEHHYELEYRSGRNFGGLTAPWTSISIYPSNVSRVAQLNIEDGHSIYVYRSHNFTFLPPLSLLRFRLRVVTSSGFSEWTPLRSKSTLDVDVDEELPAPSIVEFNHNGGNVTIETAGKVSCYMIYTGRSDSVSSPFVWSGVGCFEQSSFYLFPTIHGGHFSIRSCIRREPFLCSNATDYHVNNDSGSSHAGVLIAVTVLVPLVMVAALGALLFTCCRRDFFLKPYKADLDDGIRREEIPKLSMPKVETKNTVEHGSQADSGVFTLRSAQEFPNNCPLSV
ncbi:hypothetical protein L596_003291 [Steinernema carpocapsae]|uniref:Ig-like domain-containing protein n=1 Tax=Steinernema carpocapsae TaxID=34508 RepID=A0A4V6I7P5_STECR|nr:hypothetical protein L596_003291 [Steinernema carpocapsae]